MGNLLRAAADGLSKYALAAKAVLVVLALVVAALGGAAHVQRKFDKYKTEVVAADAVRDAEIRRLSSLQPVIKERVVTQYVDRVKTIVKKGETIYASIPSLVPYDSGLLPPGFRLLHDAAAGGDAVPPAAGGADGGTDRPEGPPSVVGVEPVPARDAAETVVTNYLSCQKNSAQLRALQLWVRTEYQENHGTGPVPDWMKVDGQPDWRQEQN